MMNIPFEEPMIITAGIILEMRTERFCFWTIGKDTPKDLINRDMLGMDLS